MVKPTINDIVRIAGVSPQTVAQVMDSSSRLSEVERDKIEQINAELGHSLDVQQDTRAKPANLLIGIVYDASAFPFLAQVQQGVAEAIRGSNFAAAAVLVSNRDEPPGNAIQAFVEHHRPTGLLLLPPYSQTEELARLAARNGCSIGGLGPGAEDMGKNIVALDEREAVKSAINYLFVLGHRRIGFVSGPQSHTSAKLRELGFLDAMAEHELDRGAQLIANGDYSFRSGLEAGKMLLDVSPRPTALFASNDEMAAGLIHAARERGLHVPRDLSIIGFEDTAIAQQIFPALTTVRLPYADMARRGAIRLIGPEQAVQTAPLVFADLVTRASTGPAPG